MADSLALVVATWRLPQRQVHALTAQLAATQAGSVAKDEVQVLRAQLEADAAEHRAAAREEVGRARARVQVRHMPHGD
jgi:hypothetical protein